MRNCECKEQTEAMKERENALCAAFLHAAAAADMVMLEHLHKAGVNTRRCVGAIESAAEQGNVKLLKFLLPKYDPYHLDGGQVVDVIHAASQSLKMNVVQLVVDWIERKPLSSPPPVPQTPGS